MRLQAEQELRRWDEVLATLAALGRLDAIGEAERDALARAAHLGNLNRKAQDSQALSAYWKQLPSDMRLDATLAAAAARYFLAAGGSEEAQSILEQALERDWNPALVALYGEAHGTTALPQIERAERWLRDHPRDPALLLTLGKLCMKQGLWGKAQSCIEASLAMEPSQDGHMTLAALMEQIGKPNEAVRHFRRSAELSG
jgi:HemY protein